MSIIDTLITNRTQADVDALLALYAKPKAMWTTDEWNEFLLGNHRGAYNATDMNRVLDALDYLAERVTEFGYQKPEIKRPNITENAVTESSDLSTLLLIHGEAIEDQSPNAATITNSGVTVSATQSVFGGSSLYFNGSGRLDVNIADIGLDLNGDWTIDFWKYATANTNTSAYVCMPNGQRGFVIGSPSGGYDRIFSGNTGAEWGFIPISNIGTATTGAWGHRAVVKSGSTIYAFENGTLYATISTSGTLTMTDVLTIGYRSTTTNTGGFTGYLDELRISNVARWTSDFTPPDVPYQSGSSTIVRDYYAIGDRPPESDLAQYLTNVAAIRAVLDIPSDVPPVPTDISQRITIEDANNIEIILTTVESLLNRISLSWLYSGEVYSGEV